MDVNSFELNLSQQFNLRAYEDLIKNLTKAELELLLVDAMRLLMVKDNIIRDLAKDSIIYGKPLL